MSSHHFVKEGQEPALFILEQIPFRCIEPLLEWVPLILVADTVLDNVLLWGIKIDIVFQYKHRIEKLEDQLKDQMPLEIILSEQKIISRGLQFLTERKHESVNLIITPTEEIFQEIERSANHLQVSAYGANEKWLRVTSGKFEKWMHEGDRLSIRYEPGAYLKTAGIVRNGSDWETVHSGIVTIESKSPFWIREPF